MLNQGEILTLNDNKVYSVVYSTVYNNSNYAYLIDQNDYSNNMFCKYDLKDGLEEVKDPEILEYLLKKFQDEKNSHFKNKDITNTADDYNTERYPQAICPICKGRLMFMVPSGSPLYCKSCDKFFENNGGAPGKQIEKPKYDPDVIY